MKLKDIIKTEIGESTTATSSNNTNTNTNTTTTTSFTSPTPTRPPMPNISNSQEQKYPKHTDDNVAPEPITVTEFSDFIKDIE